MKLLIILVIFFAAAGLFFAGRSKLITLKPFVNLKGVQDYELEVMDYKRAESEIVTEKENYPKFYKGGKTGVLLIHGFTGAPYELIPLAEYLHSEGFTVYLARVAGHGSDPENLNELTYEDWYESVKYGYFLLKNNCDKIIVTGQSMGGLIALNTVIKNGADGLILLAPCIKIKNPLSVFVPYVKHFKKYDHKNIEADEQKFFYNTYPMEGVHQLIMFTEYTEPLAEKINIPVLMFQHMGDKVVSAEASREFFGRIGSQNKKAVYFDNDDSGYHALCGAKNPHRDDMFAEIKEWIDVIK
ncbi:alpha/beta fold hydrolase [Geovibrio thiophilus]|uniref:Alpha/beta fold hydrolase n=1 Tax=Geovibrio thiophilus TaxID=139438 RepID=A0A3R5Y6Z8_9BACT|nr:alpha/beta fold hydrolase [Geovibrio thiophilus]QAR33236.1 alpha/beta fold hydrolase [Geovibrio thiophilus]